MTPAIFLEHGNSQGITSLAHETAKQETVIDYSMTACLPKCTKFVYAYMLNKLKEWVNIVFPMSRTILTHSIKNSPWLSPESLCLKFDTLKLPIENLTNCSLFY